nr:MAG TPA: hypothetical protein [Caudoviricetes sp.]
MQYSNKIILHNSVIFYPSCDLERQKSPYSILLISLPDTESSQCNKRWPRGLQVEEYYTSLLFSFLLKFPRPFQHSINIYNSDTRLKKEVFFINSFNFLNLDCIPSMDSNQVSFLHPHDRWELGDKLFPVLPCAKFIFFGVILGIQPVLIDFCPQSAFAQYLTHFYFIYLFCSKLGHSSAQRAFNIFHLLPVLQLNH